MTGNGGQGYSGLPRDPVVIDPQTQKADAASVISIY